MIWQEARSQPLSDENLPPFFGPADVIMIHDDFKVPLSVLNLLKQEKGVLAFCG